MWLQGNVKQIVFMLIFTFLICAYGLYLYLRTTFSRPIYFHQAKPVDRHMDETLSFASNLLGNLEQYNTGVDKLSRRKLAGMIREKPYKDKRLSEMRPEFLQFKVIRNTSADNIEFLLHVTDNNAGVCGCNFDARQLYGSYVAMCLVEEHGNGSYGVRCASHGSKCGSITITARFCDFEAYLNYPRILMWQHQVLQQEYCVDHVTKIPSDIPSWELSPDGQCNKLLLYDEPLVQMSKEDVCHCIKTRFDDVYLIGTSHIRYFSDYLMRLCYNQNFWGKAKSHPALHAHNLHYLDWAILSELQAKMHKQLDSLLRSNSSIAIWIQTGSWDFVEIHYVYAMEIGLDLFNQTLSFMKSRIEQSSARVDLRIIATSPMPDNWYFSNFAVAAFNARMQQMSMEHGISYTDAFSMQLPCANDIPNVPENRNHYLARHKNDFNGTVGINFYFGAFLPQVCLPHIRL